MAEEFAPALFALGVLVLVSNSCEGNSPRQASREIDVARAEPAAPAMRDERSDCYPGAPPNSLANALDPLKAHCDRGKAIAKIATIAGIGLLARGRGGAGAARAAGTRVVTAEALTAETGAAGAAADSVALTEMGAGRAAAAMSRTYRVTASGERRYVAEAVDGGAAETAAYGVEAQGGGAYRVTPPTAYLSRPLNVRVFGPDAYEVEAADGTRTVVNARELRA